MSLRQEYEVRRTWYCIQSIRKHINHEVHQLLFSLDFVRYQAEQVFNLVGGLPILEAKGPYCGLNQRLHHYHNTIEELKSLSLGLHNEHNVYNKNQNLHQ